MTIKARALSQHPQWQAGMSSHVGDASETGVAAQLVNERGVMDICACMQHKGYATRTLVAVDISTRRHIGYAIIAKCSASAQAISGAAVAAVHEQ